MKPENEYATQVLDLASILMGCLNPTGAYYFGSEEPDENDKRPATHYFRGPELGLLSDSLTELAEKAMHGVESAIGSRLRNRDVVYLNLKLPESQFDKYFRPNPNGTVSFYVDTIRRVVAQLRKDHQV